MRGIDYIAVLLNPLGLLECFLKFIRRSPIIIGQHSRITRM